MVNSYGKKQKKHTRSVYINTDNAYYVNSERTQFAFRIPPINIEDESKLYVRNTNTDYKDNMGLSVKNVNTGLFLGSTATFGSTYSTAPAITFVSQDGKGTGATAVGLLAPSGLSGSATTTTTTVNVINAGAGYTGVAADYVVNPIVPTTGGTGASITSGTLTTATGSFSPSGTLAPGSGYTEVPIMSVPAPPATVLATFATVPYTAATGVITGTPAVNNPTTNGFYNSSTFTASFVNNPIRAEGIYQTNATGGIISVIITNSADNGYYGSDYPTVLPFTGGTGFTYTPTYSGGRVVSIIVNTPGSGYGNNLVDFPFLCNVPATPVAGTITAGTITNGRLTAITFGVGGSRYYKPTVAVNTGVVPPSQATYEPVFKIASALAGVRMLTHGRGYTFPPKPIIATTNRISNAGDLPLIAEITPTYLVEKNNYFTIKADGFQFNRALYTNTDNKGVPTIAVCSTNENVNNEDYIELILPAQVINDFTLTIFDRDGLGLEANKNMTLLLTIEELDDEHTDFEHSKRQLY